MQHKLRRLIRLLLTDMWPFDKKIEDVLCGTKKIRVHGVLFTIKKIDPTAYLDGSKAMTQVYDIYKVGKEPSPEVNQSLMNKVKDHYRDVFMASIVSPKLRRRDKDGEGLLVDYLFTDWDFASELYAQIMQYTYGKKKIL